MSTYRGKHPSAIRTVAVAGKRDPGAVYVTTNAGNTYRLLAKNTRGDMPQLGESIDAYPSATILRSAAAKEASIAEYKRAGGVIVSNPLRRQREVVPPPSPSLGQTKVAVTTLNGTVLAEFRDEPSAKRWATQCANEHRISVRLVFPD